MAQNEVMLHQLWNMQHIVYIKDEMTKWSIEIHAAANSVVQEKCFHLQIDII